MSSESMPVYRVVVEFSAWNEADAFEILEDCFPQADVIGKPVLKLEE